MDWESDDDQYSEVSESSLFEEDDHSEVSKPKLPDLFEQAYCVQPFSKYKNPHIESGDKIIMPQSFLSKIASASLNVPFLLQIESYIDEIVSHCGILEFDAEESCIHMPEWMMRNFKLQEGDLAIIRNASLPKATYVKLQPHTTYIQEVSDPKAVLEKTLLSFTCLSKGGTIVVKCNEKEFNIDVLDVWPEDAVCLIDTDCKVDFVMPFDYMEPELAKEPEVEKKIESDFDVDFVASLDYAEPDLAKEPEVEKKIDTDCPVDFAASMDYMAPNLAKEPEAEKKTETVYNCCVDVKKAGANMELVPFTGKARRLDGEAVTMTDESCRYVTVVDGLAKARTTEKKKDCCKEKGKEKFKAFTGRSYASGRRSTAMD